MLPVDVKYESKVRMNEAPSRKERNFPHLELSDPSTLSATSNQPVLVVQSPKTPTLSRKLKAVSLDSDPPKQTASLEISRDVFSMPNTPKRQIKPKYCCDFDDGTQKLTIAPSLSTNLKRFGSNTSISGSQTLKTLPEIMTLQDFSDNRTEPVRIKAKGLLERRGSNASLTIDLGSNSNIAESKVMPTLRLNPAKSVSNLNLSAFGADRCPCSNKCDGHSFGEKTFGERKLIPSRDLDRRKSQTYLEKCGNCTIYESEPSKSNMCKIKCQTFNKKCGCLCNFKSRRKSLSNENLYVPPCNFCQNGGQKDCISSAKGHRRACYPRQADLEASQLLSEDFKLHLQNIQYLQTAGSVLSITDLKSSCETHRVPKLHQEFWEVPLNLQEKCLVSGSQSRNRYKGVLPNEHSRVHLPGPQSYIHANYIKGPDYTETSYIATQGPMAHTCEDFWEMVWISKSNCIVMLTGLIEKGRSKCELYFPLGKKSGKQEKSFFLVKTSKAQDKFTFESRNTQQYEEEIIQFEELNHIQYGKYKITHISEDLLGECAIRCLELHRTQHGKSKTRIVYHYWYSNWQDHKMANPEQVLKMALHVIELVDKFNLKHDESNLKHDEINDNNNIRSQRRSDIGLGRRDDIKCFDSIKKKPSDKMLEFSKNLEQSSHLSNKTSNTLESRYLLGSKIKNSQKSKVKSTPQENGETSSKYTKFSNKFSSDALDVVKESEAHKSVDKKKSPDKNKVPVIVHCSAGIGRTGCFLAVLNGIQQLRSNFNVDVLALLCSLRLHRGGMVQTAEQYELIHRVLSLYTDVM